jgi:hypothetical protein
MLQEPLWLICHNNGTTSTTVLRNVVHLSAFFLIFWLFFLLHSTTILPLSDSLLLRLQSE